MIRLDRRSVLTAAVGTAALGIGGAAALLKLSSSETRSPIWRSGPVSSMAFVAHPDDSIYFFTPALMAALRSGEEHTTVLLTMGESDGRNAPPETPDYDKVPVDFEKYAAARLNGMRSAYADMVFGEPDATWSRSPVPLAPGTTAELLRLDGAPHIKIISLNLWDNPDSVIPGHGRLTEVWEGKADAVTMRPTGSAVTSLHAYTRRQLIDSLLGLLRTHEPTVVWTMDPDPEYQVHDEAHPVFSDSGNYSDHATHTATALFTFAALQDWWSAANRTTAVQTFRGYYVRRWPSNLTPAARDTKERLIAAYSGRGRACADPIGCGDRKIGSSTIGRGNASGTTLRYPGAGRWFGRGKDGRMAAFVVLGGRAMMWRERAPGANDYDGPHILDSPQMLPNIDASLRPDGSWQIAGLGMKLAAAADEQTRNIVTATVHPAASKPPQWTSIGGPDLDSPERRRGVGQPAVVCLPDGRIQILVRTYDKTLASRLRQADGSWLGWQGMGGDDFQDGLATVLRPDGEIVVFAAGGNGIRQWTVNPGESVDVDLAIGSPPAGPLTATLLKSGSPACVARVEDAEAAVLYLNSREGLPDLTSGRLVEGVSGPGPVSVVRLDDKDSLVLVWRDDNGCVAAAAWQEPGTVTRFELGRAFQIANSPAVAADAKGRAVIAAIDTAGALRTVAQTAAGPRAPFGEWTEYAA